MSEIVKPTDSPELRVSYASLLSQMRLDKWVWAKNKWFIQMSEKLGYGGKVEGWMTRGAARDIWVLPETEVFLLTRESIGSVHVNPEPDATLWKVLTKKSGSVWGGGKYGKENLAFVDSSRARQTIGRMQRIAQYGGYTLPVVTYPHFESGIRTYGYYPLGWELVETHPEAFESEWGHQAYIEAVQDGMFGGVCVDSHHLFGKTPSGKVPFENWKESLQKLFDADVVEEFHFQPGRSIRVDEDGRSRNLQALREVATGTIQDQALAEMVEMLGKYNRGRIEQGKPPAPIVTEITLPSLVKAGVLSARSLFTYEGLAEAHKKIIAAIRGVY